jgi:hypothetical protein
VGLGDAAVLLGLQLARHARRGRRRIGDLREHFRVRGLEVLDHLLGELQVAGDVEDVQLDRLARLVGHGSGIRRLAAVAAGRAAGRETGGEAHRQQHSSESEAGATLHGCSLGP